MFFTIYLDPVPKARPRFNRKTGRVRTPKRTTNFEKAIKKKVQRQLGEDYDFPMFGENVGVLVQADFVFERPKRLMRKKDPLGLVWKTTLPDSDNLVKAVLDGLNGVLWHDDRQVVDVRIRKFYAEKAGKARVCLSVMVIEDPPQATCDFWNADLLDARVGRKVPTPGGSCEEGNKSTEE
jgi:Holliday junction resolvase RusA-like endonuclease